MTSARHVKPKNRPCSHRRYLLSCDDYEELRARADYQCEICGSPEKDQPHGVLSIDHDGCTGIWAVRGLLCNRCNTALHLPAISGEARDRYYANSWHLGMLASRGLCRSHPPSRPWGA